MNYSGGEVFLLLGGGGMVGQEIAYEIARELNPSKFIICDLSRKNADETAQKISSEFKDRVIVEPIGGDIFVRHKWNPSSGPQAKSFDELTEAEVGERRKARYDDTFGPIDQAYGESELVWLIKTYTPDVIIDSINTATAISYQDVYTASFIANDKLTTLKQSLEGSPGEQANDESANVRMLSSVAAFEDVIISQSIPQLVRHVLLVNRAMRQYKTRLYLKVGTTGTGGMGLNIPYTHSEESPSDTLMEKTAVAFAHTGLLYLMARTLDGPVVKEFKPAAMIGYSDIATRTVQVRKKGKVGTPGENFKLYQSKTEVLFDKGQLRLCPPKDADEAAVITGDLKLPVINTGENGRFTKGEFQAITAMRQMEFITPEEIARQAVLEVKGSNTGYDVIAAIDGASMNPTYRAGYLREFALRALEELEEDDRNPSVALGELGPPELGKLLWEAYLLHRVYKRETPSDDELEKVQQKTAADLSCEVDDYLMNPDRKKLLDTIVSVGFPVLRSDGTTLVRGPYIRIPQRKERETEVYNADLIEKWAAKGWVDLREKNMALWQSRFRDMRHETKSINERGSAAFTRDSYLSKDIRIGVVVAWIFNNERDDRGKLKFGYRIK